MEPSNQKHSHLALNGKINSWPLFGDKVKSLEKEDPPNDKVGQGQMVSPTDTCSDATTLSAAFYGTPYTSLSGFDVYMTAFEDSLYSIDRIPIKREMSKDEPEQQDVKITVNPIMVTNAVASTSSPKGKGGERMKDSGKCTPKKSAFTSPKKSTEMKHSTSTESTEKSQNESIKTQNGSIKTSNTNNSDDMSKFKKGLLGGTKAILIEKVSIITYDSNYIMHF
ncbi:hypothetical protein FSP39_021887 [Pinctada imbricata]|uniref:Uncharacterized protein n=1 Tax=Pinctada imbricata TaxID=66713 RepID=A0AA88YFY3_PINIB|nr:hypothetical protein FSP39_021887 [Pinctada imbricata]